MQREWTALYGLMQYLMLQGTAAFYVAHTTKDLRIAGPKKLEHEVGTVMMIRRAFSYRLIEVTKNRYGPCTDAPIVCTADREGRLFPAQRGSGVVVAKPLAFDELGIIEVEAKVEFRFANGNQSRRLALSGVTKNSFMKVGSILRGMGVAVQPTLDTFLLTL